MSYPALFGLCGKQVDCPINTPDIPATLLHLCGLEAPPAMDGLDYAPFLLGDSPQPPAEDALLACYQPFGEFNAVMHQGREYRGLRTRRYTYTRTLAGPWHLYDNEIDPYQQRNLVNLPEYAPIQQELEDRLQSKLADVGDEFLPGMEYIRRWGYPVDATGTVPYID